MDGMADALVSDMAAAVYFWTAAVISVLSYDGLLVLLAVPIVLLAYSSGLIKGHALGRKS